MIIYVVYVEYLQSLRGRKFSEVFIACVENIDLSLFLVHVSFTVSQVFVVLIEIKFHISYVRVSL